MAFHRCSFETDGVINASSPSSGDGSNFFGISFARGLHYCFGNGSSANQPKFHRSKWFCFDLRPTLCAYDLESREADAHGTHG